MSGFLTDPASAEGVRFIEDLRNACHSPGFVYLSGHGVPKAINDDLMTVAGQFFSLTEAERRALAIENSAAFRGYTILGEERTNGRSDWRDQLDIGPEQSAPEPGATVPAWHRLRGPNQWPPSLPNMAGVVLRWMDALDHIGLTALRALALGLGQPIDHFDDGFVPESDVHLKIIRYPAVDGVQNSQGVGLHHDSGLLSFILQDSVGGLQVQINGEMVDAPPVHGAYIMNLGEMLQTATSGYLRATPHRVVSPPGESERLSIAYFFNPRFESVFSPIDLPDELAKDAVGGQNANPDDPVHAIFGENNLKIRLRAHPNVAERHYADVLAAQAAEQAGSSTAASRDETN